MPAVERGNVLQWLKPGEKDQGRLGLPESLPTSTRSGSQTFLPFETGGSWAHYNPLTCLLIEILSYFMGLKELKEIMSKMISSLNWKSLF